MDFQMDLKDLKAGSVRACLKCRPIVGSKVRVSLYTSLDLHGPVILVDHFRLKLLCNETMDKKYIQG